jgi:molybdate transport system ATP-binding protein
LLELQAALRIPMLLITHDEADVRSLAQQVVHLEAGRVVGG